MDAEVIDREFAEDVLGGLSSTPKRLMSRYFYDERGDRLFQAIMASDEYYLTDSELEILDGQGPDIAAEIAAGGPFDLVELGSGDGSKIRHLLDALHGGGIAFTYQPVDISANVLELLERRLRPGRPWLDMQPLALNYMDWLAGLSPDGRRRVFAFMGANIGNFGESGAVEFLSVVRRAMGSADALLIGLDLKKDPEVIRAAYDDAAGITAEFNLNLLRRINRELGADFDLDRWTHEPEYDPDTGAARSFLRSTGEQRVTIGSLDRRFDFADGERIFMEISQKYDANMIEALAAGSGFRVAAAFEDRRGWFTDQVWRPVDR